MKYSESIKPISYLKAHASEIFRELTEKQQTLIITQNGEAKAVVQDIKSYEELQESLSLLKILAQSTSDIQKGNIKPAREVFNNLRSRHKPK
jgi:prevent-host-death family protein